jgi:superoxide dismutase, Fe-Mn family
MYELKPLACNPAALDGLSEKLIVSHYENNYGGAVKRLNQIQEHLATLDFANAPGFLINGLKREELIAMNSMILHEIYACNSVQIAARRLQQPPYPRRIAKEMANDR